MTEIVLYAAGALLALAFLLAMIRFAIGPRAVDRVVACDRLFCWVSRMKVEDP